MEHIGINLIDLLSLAAFGVQHVLEGIRVQGVEGASWRERCGVRHSPSVCIGTCMEMCYRNRIGYSKEHANGSIHRYEQKINKLRNSLASPGHRLSNSPCTTVP